MRLTMLVNPDRIQADSNNPSAIVNRISKNVGIVNNNATASIAKRARVVISSVYQERSHDEIFISVNNSAHVSKINPINDPHASNAFRACTTFGRGASVGVLALVSSMVLATQYFG